MTKAERKICFEGVKIDRALAASPDFLQWSDDQKLHEWAVSAKGHLAFLCDEIYIRDELLKIVVSRATADPEHNWLTCSEPSCMLVRDVLGEG